MRKLLLLVGLGVMNISLAQGTLEFINETHDFGDIKEEDGFAEYTFNFVNTGDQPIKITHVKASCGCTTPGWTREEIMPGDSGFVKARYNPRNRPGRFRKSLRISSNTPSENKTLYISGMVKPKAKTITEELPIAAGDLRLKYRSMNLGRITTEKIIEKEFDVYNAGSDSLSLQYQLMDIPEHVQLAMIPELLGPKEKGMLKITYDPIKKNDLGFISDNITIHADTLMREKNLFYVIATIEEFFPEMTAEELDSAPKLLIEERVYDFGKVNEADTVRVDFVLNNAGKKKLNFRKIKSNCSCVTFDVKSQNLKKGKSQTLSLRFDTTGRRGNQYKTVSIFSNDPVNPTQLITIKGSIQKREEGR